MQAIESQAEVRELLEAVRRQLADTAELTAVEFRYATVSALGILFLVVLAAASVVLFWGLLLAAAIVALNAAGFAWPAITVGFAVIHGAIAAVCWQSMLRLTHNLSLPALRAALAESFGAEAG